MARTAVTVTALKTENHVPLTKFASNAASMEKPQQCNYVISSKEPVQPKYQINFGVGTIQSVPGLKNRSALLRSEGSKAILFKYYF